MIHKFRAWDTLDKKFLWPWPEGFHILGEVTCFDLITQQLKESMHDRETILDRINDVEILQFTGLIDGNGKEIYEGDILLSQRYSTRPYSQSAKHKRFRMVVEYRLDENVSEWCTREIEKRGDYRYGSWGDFFDCEIIGNRFENPEFLNVHQ